MVDCSELIDAKPGMRVARRERKDQLSLKEP
jgi:hypothetical protein